MYIFVISTVRNINDESADNHRRHRQQLHLDDLSTQKPNHYNKQSSTKTIWRPLSTNRLAESIDPISQESIIYKSQQQTNDHRQSESYQQRINMNDYKQRYQTINTASVPSLMKPKTTNEEVSIKKPNETSVLTPTTKVLAKEIGKSDDSGNGILDEKVAIKNDNGTNVVQTENELTKINKKTTTTPSSTNSK
ncbi:unnamed protein product [Adineta steineri]|uniref:Uncharacterized protein n=1 Tax=Adineta steineri TaxID=433720 RepID=A0A814PXP2_9BILA|nr:unnamed protein product [Adineta steineri]CAF3994758.1 unnamed protein product [Adineta steineri]